MRLVALISKEVNNERRCCRDRACPIHALDEWPLLDGTVLRAWPRRVHRADAEAGLKSPPTLRSPDRGSPPRPNTVSCMTRRSGRSGALNLRPAPPHRVAPESIGQDGPRLDVSGTEPDNRPTPHEARSGDTTWRLRNRFGNRCRRNGRGLSCERHAP